MAERFFLKMIVDNNRGVMARIATLLSRKGYNIGSICVGKHLADGEASMLLTIVGEQAEVMNAKQLLGKLVNVISIEAFPEDLMTERELCMLRVTSGSTAHKKLAEGNAHILKEDDGFVVAEVIDYPSQINALVDSLKEQGLIEVSRSGANAI